MRRAADSIFPLILVVATHVMSTWPLPDEILFLRFDEGKGVIANDTSGKANAGKIFGAGWATGKLNSALLFDGVDDRVEVPDSDVLDLRTVEVQAWIKAEQGGPDDQWRYVLEKGNQIFALYLVNGERQPRFGVTTVKGWSSATAPVRLELSRWYHLRGTYDGNKLQMWVNGELAASRFCEGELMRDSYPLVIGTGCYASNNFFAGLIDEVRISGKVRRKPAATRERYRPDKLLEARDLCKAWGSEYDTDPLLQEAPRAIFKENPVLTVQGRPHPGIAFHQVSPLPPFDIGPHFPTFIGKLDCHSFPDSGPILDSIRESKNPLATYILGCYFDIAPADNNPVTLPWYRSHPDELIRTEDSQTTRVSYASSQWKRDFGQHVREFVRSITGSPYGNQIIGIHIAGGGAGQWGLCGNPGPFSTDHSPAMLQYFKDWSRNRYKTLDDLRDAWCDSAVTFETVSLPTVEEKKDGFLGMFRDPNRHKKVIDYYDCFSDALTETIIEFAKIIKEENPRLLTCPFYGGAAASSFQSNPAKHGMCRLTKLADHPSIDAIAEVYNYYDRRNTDFSVQLPDSIQLRGKLVFNESDQRVIDDPIRHHLMPDLNLGPDRKAIVERLKRNACYSLIRRHNFWWMLNADGSKGYADENIQWVMKQTAQIADAALQVPDRKVDEIAVLVSQDSWRHLICYPDTDWILSQYARMGLPFGVYALEDLDRIPEHKFYIFHNSVYVPDNLRELIDKKLKTRNRVLLWLYSPGLIADKGISKENMYQLTGIKIDYEDAPFRGISISEANHPVTKSFERDTIFGADSIIPSDGAGHNRSMPYITYPSGETRTTLPTFYADDRSCTVLGRNISNGHAGLVVKQFENWTSIYCSIPLVPAQMLKNMARLAGAHIYSDSDDVVYASRNFLCLFSLSEGQKTIALPRKVAAVHDVFDGNKIIGKNTNKLTVSVPECTTKLYSLR